MNMFALIVLNITRIFIMLKLKESIVSNVKSQVDWDKCLLGSKLNSFSVSEAFDPMMPLRIKVTHATNRLGSSKRLL